MSVPCPCCKASNDTGPACRRCKADLSLLFAVESERVSLVAAARTLAAEYRHSESLAALERADNGAWNIGTGVLTSVNGVVDALRQYLGPPPAGVRYAPPRAGELQRACVDPSKAARDGFWRPTVSFVAGIGLLLAEAKLG